MMMVGVSRGGGTRVKTQQLPGELYRGSGFHNGFHSYSAGYNLHYTSGNEEALRSPVCVAGRVDQTPDSPRTFAQRPPGTIQRRNP